MQQMILQMHQPILKSMYLLLERMMKTYAFMLPETA